MSNLFNNDAFNLVAMTGAVNELKFVPGRIADLGLFEVDCVATTEVVFERKGETLMLVPPTPRGGPGVTQTHARRILHRIAVAHFEINDSVNADEVQGVRAFGQTNETETVSFKAVEKMGAAVRNMALTEEHSRMGAIRGVVEYADGSQLNLFTEFGVVPEPEVNFDLSNLSAIDGTLRKVCAGIIRKTADVLGGTPAKRLHSFCGDNFFDALLGHPEVRESFKGWNEAKILREGYVASDKSSWGSFEFGGIVWENYRGATGISGFIETNKCSIFPVGVPGLFKTIYSPADYVETVNTIAQRLYAKSTPFPNGKGMNIDVQMNALQYCARPKTLVSGRL